MEKVGEEDMGGQVMKKVGVGVGGVAEGAGQEGGWPEAEVKLPGSGMDKCERDRHGGGVSQKENIRRSGDLFLEGLIE